jgi:murein DD-endopeptidase MepM/ murein hydrolase activator NlpD
VVVYADALGIYGNTVMLDHGLGVFSSYSHMSKIGVKVGDKVQKGAVLGQTGTTGLAAGDHLHFAINLQGEFVDPLEWWDPVAQDQVERFGPGPQLRRQASRRWEKSRNRARGKKRRARLNHQSQRQWTVVRAYPQNQNPRPKT